MPDLVKNIREMGLEWFLASLEQWEVNTEIDMAGEVIDDLNEYLSEERSYAE